MKKILLALTLGLFIGGIAQPAHASVKPHGNGNDGCQIGDIPGHKDHGQSNEHKIDYMTKMEWLLYLEENNIIAEQKSNNDDSNGWITWHIYNNCGNQIEVVHIRYKKDEVVLPPVEDGSDEDNMEVHPPAVEEELEGQLPDIGVEPPTTLPDDILIPNPPVEDGSEDDNIMVEPPTGDKTEEDDNTVTPEIPVKPEDNIEEERLPETGGVSSLLLISTAIGSIITGKRLLKK